jgi:hypothetical protein
MTGWSSPSSWNESAGHIVAADDIDVAMVKGGTDETQKRTRPVHVPPMLERRRVRVEVGTRV